VATFIVKFLTRIFPIRKPRPTAPGPETVCFVRRYVSWRRDADVKAQSGASAEIFPAAEMKHDVSFRRTSPKRTGGTILFFSAS
jgi:hypothetical protein